jgi:hypothetical protein
MRPHRLFLQPCQLVWIEDFIGSNRRVEDIEEAQDDNFLF